MRYADLDLGDEDRLADYLKELITGGDLQDAALGVAKQFLTKGYGSLSEKQEYVLDQHIIDVYVAQRCKRCEEKISWEEMYFAYQNGGYCGYCNKIYESMQRE
jgi:hypothetical protein